MNFLLKYRNLLMALLGLVTLFFGGCMFLLKVEFSFDNFFPKDENLEFYRDYQKHFGDDDNILFIALGNHGESIFNTRFLEKSDSLASAFSRILRVDSVIHPAHFPVLRRTPFGAEKEPLLVSGDPSTYTKARKKIQEDSALFSPFFSRNEQYLCLVVLLDSAITDSPERDRVCEEAESILKQSGTEYVISGVPYIRSQYAERITSELLFFVSLAFALVLVILFLTYRNLWGILIPLAGVAATLIWTLGFMALTGKAIDLTIELMPPILFVVGMSDVVHLITKYSQELSKGKEKLEAMKIALDDVGMAILLTSVSTAIGFASLVLSGIGPLRDFGIFAGAGVMFAYAITIVLVPGALLLLPPEKITASKGVKNSPIWDKLLEGILEWTKRNSKPVLIVFTLFVGVSSWGIRYISYNAYLLDDVGPRDPIIQSIRFFETNFFGVRPFELAILAKPGHKVLDQESLKGMEAMESYLVTRTRFAPFLSPVSLVKNLNRFSHFGNARHFSLPDSAEKTRELLDLLVAEGDERLLRAVVSKDESMARISSRLTDMGTDNFAALRSGLDSVYRFHCDTNAIRYRITGSAHLAEMNIHYIRDGMFPDLLLSVFLVALLMGFLFRSTRMVIIALIPNLIPLVITAGMMGLLGITLRPSSAMVFAITFGIVVDDTMHFMSRLKVELSMGLSLEDALKETLMGTGKAMIITTFILIGGFFLLLFSDFGGTFIFGLFCTVTLFTGMLSDLYLLPVIIRLLYKK